MSETKTLSASQQLNRERVLEIKEQIQNSSSFVVLDYKGLTVAQDTELRQEFRKNNIVYKVYKNTLFKIALHELGYNDFDEDLNGTSAFAFGSDDALAPAKLTAENAKKFSKIKIKCGLFEEKYADAELVQQLSQIPNREQLLGMLVSVLSAPIRGLAVALNAVAEKGE